MIGFTVLASLALIQGQGWATPATLILDGNEKVGSGPERPFRIQVAKGKTLYATTRGILDWSGGPTRLETHNANGFFTWIEGSSRTLRLAVPSHPDLATWFQQVRLAKAALASGEVNQWRVGVPETIAGKPAWKISSSTKPTQSLWIDQQFGLALRQEDETISGSIRYRRNFTNLQVDSPLEDSLFQAPSNLPLLGIPHPSILVRPSLTAKITAYGQDLQAIKKKSKLGADLWLKQIDVPSGYEYSGTHFEESNGKVVREVWPRNQLGGPEFEPGGMPPGWAAKAEMSEDGKQMMVRFSKDGNPGAAVMMYTPTGREGNGFKISQGTFEDGAFKDMLTIEYTAFIADDGALVFGVGQDAQQARLRRENSKLDLARASVVVQTDFVEAKSGNTVSLFQVRGRTWQSCALLPKLDSPDKLDLGGMSFEVWKLKESFPLTVLSWTEAGTTYVLASSKLSEQELATLAASSKKSS